MAPQLALLLCTIFVLFLLRLERKQTPEVSFALWIPTIWMLCIASKPLSSWLGWGYDTEGSQVDQIFLGGLLCLGLVILVRRKFDWSGVIRGNPWVVLLIVYMFLSILWSDIPYISFKRWVRELVAVIMAFLVLTERDPRQAMQCIFKKIVYILIPFSPVVIKYFPEYGRRYSRWTGVEEWTGVALQKNGLGRLCLIAAFFLIWTLFRRWEKGDASVGKLQTYADVFVLMITFWLLKGPPGGYSATAIGALAVGLAVFLSLLWMKKYGRYLGAKTMTVMMALIIGYGIVTPIVGGLSFGTDISSTLGRDDTLTGRTEVWADLLPVAMQRPILGHGFGGFWAPLTRKMHDIGEAHNGYLEIMLELGFVGILLFSMFLLRCCRKAQGELRHDFYWASLWICFLLMAAVHNVTESSLNDFQSHLTAILLFLAVSVQSHFEPPQHGMLQR